MNYRKGLQSLIMAMVLVGIGVLSAEAKEPAFDTALQQYMAFQQWGSLHDQFAAHYQAGIMLVLSSLHDRGWRWRSVLSVLSIPPLPSVSTTWPQC
jgi:VanZ family protein